MVKGIDEEQQIASNNNVLKELAKDAKNSKLKFVLDDSDFIRSDANELHLSKTGTRTPSIIAHELGHHHYRTNKDAGIIGKMAHKDQPRMLYNNTSGIISKGLHGGAGFAAGYYNGKREANGKEENKLAKWGTRLAPLAVATPVLLAEGAASLHGLRRLKGHGISPEGLKAAKKSLSSAWLNYASRPIKDTIINEIGYQGGKMLGKYNNKKKKEDK